MQLPREPRAGDNLDGAWGAQVVRYLRAITLRSGPGVRVSGGASGLTLRADSISRSIQTHPFQVTDASTSDPDAAKVAVRFGQVNSITPKIGATALDAEEPPTLSVISGVVYLEVILDIDGGITSAEVKNAATLPTPVAYSESTPGKGYVTLATVTVASDKVTAINQAVTHSLGHQLCGEAVHNFWGL